ncbi:inverse autotransporter beta domain-containing protein, partial [Immundisolibacter sp.]|uniref:inverse autotransporter beta domain-containing protein n=1 Tax=Immundisolibacter sp. TaxID=1934948 RepID=UPI00356618C3
MANANARFGDKAATLRNQAGRPPFRPTALAAAVAIALVPAYARADEWSRNIEISGRAGTNDSSHGGLAILQPLMQDEDSLTYADLRAIFADNSTNEFNLGVGHRLLRNNRILGGYLAYDWRKTGTNNKYKQVTFGAESLGDTWDFRANYYLPVGDKKNIEGVVNTGGNFIGSGLFFDGIVEEAMEGFDAEVGARIPGSPYETRVYAGGYHFKGDSTDREANGPKLRVEVRPRKNFGVELSWQDDNLFGSQTGLKLRYSFGGPSGEGIRTVSERMTQLVERDADIKENSELDWRDQVSNDDRVNVAPSGGVIHIDNSASPGGDGTNENPFTNFDDATVAGNLPGSTLVHVHAGEGPYTEDVTLSNGTLLLGETIGTLTHLTDPFSGKLRNFYLHSSEVGSDNPVMYGNGADGGEGDIMDAIVTLADDNEVAGFDFVGGNGGGYGSQFVGVGGINTSNADIHHNNFLSEGSFDTSIFLLANSSGSFTGNWIHDNNIFGGGDGIGIFSYAGPGETITQEVTISDNFVGYVYNVGIQVNNSAGYDAVATQTATLTDNVVRRSGDDAFRIGNDAYDGGDATQTATLTGNYALYSGTDGFDIDNDARRG